MNQEDRQKVMLSSAMYGVAIQRKSDGYIFTPEEVLSLTNEMANKFSDEVEETDVQVAPGIWQSKEDYEANRDYDAMKDGENFV